MLWLWERAIFYAANYSVVSVSIRFWESLVVLLLFNLNLKVKLSLCHLKSNSSHSPLSYEWRNCSFCVRVCYFRPANYHSLTSKLHWEFPIHWFQRDLVWIESSLNINQISGLVPQCQIHDVVSRLYTSYKSWLSSVWLVNKNQTIPHYKRTIL